MCACTHAGVDASLLQPYELDTAALSAKPCSIQLVLLPYGDFKQAKGAYRRSVGHAPALRSAVCALHQAHAAVQRPGLLGRMSLPGVTWQLRTRWVGCPMLCVLA